jgi:hypothetical protein
MSKSFLTIKTTHQDSKINIAIKIIFLGDGRDAAFLLAPQWKTNLLPGHVDQDQGILRMQSRLNLSILQ